MIVTVLLLIIRYKSNVYWIQLTGKISPIATKCGGKFPKNNGILETFTKRLDECDVASQYHKLLFATHKISVNIYTTSKLL